MRVAVIDIGKPGKNLGWAIDEPHDEGTDLDECIDKLIASLDEGPVALGFEAPQFVPIRHNPLTLTAGRKGEFGRPFSAGAGATVLVTSLVIVLYVLKRLRERLPHASATFDRQHPLTKPGQLLLFEVFVTDQPKTATARRIEDARLAIATSGEGWYRRRRSIVQ
jgi:hypothetical protein